jgi:hypothetical protein
MTASKVSNLSVIDKTLRFSVKIRWLDLLLHHLIPL